MNSVLVSKARSLHRPQHDSLARAVREGLIVRNPAEGEDLRLEVRREKKYGLELDEAMSLVAAASRLDQRPAPSDELRRRIVGMRATGKAWNVMTGRCRRLRR